MISGLITECGVVALGKDLNGKELGVGFRQRSNGTYTARYVDRFGQRREIYNKSLKELRMQYAKAICEDGDGLSVIDSSITLNSWFNQWIEVYKKPCIRPNSYAKYKRDFDLYVRDSLGTMRLIDIRSIHVERLLTNLKESGYSYEVRNSLRILLGDMFNKAIINECLRVSPMKGVRVYGAKKGEVRFLTETERKLFFRCCAGTFYDNLFVTAVNSGLRLGEVCALTESDLDFDNCIINVTKTLNYGKIKDVKEFWIGPPKTRTSTREVPMNDECKIALQDQIRLKHVVEAQYCHTRGVPSELRDLLFVTKFNTPINSQIASEAITRVLKEVNLTLDATESVQHFSFHCFRHTFATRCFEAGMQPKVIQHLLGHATLAMTMDLYTHVTKETMKTSLDGLAGIRAADVGRVP